MWRSFTSTFILRPLCASTAQTLLAAALFLGCGVGPLCADSVVLGIIGDFGAAVDGSLSASNELAVANLIKRWNPDFVLTLGDNNYPDGSTATIDVNIGQFYHDFIYPYLGVYGAGASSNRFFPSLGNHDWFLNGQPSMDYFALPGNERYYRYRAGPVEFFAINSNVDPDGNSPGSPQGLWLRTALTNSTARWKLVYFHHPPYSGDAGGPGNPYMRWPFAAWGANVVMSGHDHNYARIQTNGITYFINGLGGEDIAAAGTPGPGVVARYSGDFGAMRMQATESNLVSHFITRNNVLIDTFVLGDPIATPFIIVSPVSQTVPGGSDARFTVLAIGGSLRYQWFSNSIPVIGATNSTLLLKNVQPAYEADYAAIVFSGSASNQTAPARLTILRHPLITLEPHSLTALTGTTVSFRVAAQGAGTLGYQWHWSGNDIPGATSSNLVLTNITLGSAGDYAVLVTDDLGSILSATATLTVYQRPIITQHPVGQSAAVGQMVVWSVSAEGNLPLSYSWRRNSRIITNIILNSFTCFWAIPNIQLTNAGNYQVGITNIAGPASGLTSNALLVVLEDRDRDGLPDAWETELGLDPDNPADASLDLDGDGASNLNEYLAGTDPLSAQSYLRIEKMSPSGNGQWELQFNALSNRTYAVEYQDSAANPWQILADFQATSTNRSIALPIEPVTQRFYRLATPRLR